MNKEERLILLKHLKYNHSIGAGYLIIGEDADEIIKALEQTRWIPVSERLPDIDEEVLVDDGKDRYIAWYVNDGIDDDWHSFDESYNPNIPIKAWMPLPEPYKVESEE